MGLNCAIHWSTGHWCPLHQNKGASFVFLNYKINQVNSVTDIQWSRWHRQTRNLAIANRSSTEYAEGIYSKFVSLKSRLRVTQSHWNWYYLKAWVQFLICLPPRYSDLLVENHQIFISRRHLVPCRGWHCRNFAKTFDW